jgi:glutathione S-transferase
MIPTVSAYTWVPPMAQGFVKDLRIRWALEEAGIPYEIKLVAMKEAKAPAYRRWQPFGQVPAYEDDAGMLFESGAIVLDIAARSEALAPRDAAGRRRITAWVIAALNSVEPFVQNYLRFDDDGDAAKSEKRRQHVQSVLNLRLESLVNWLGAEAYLEAGRFTAADLMMAMVLRELMDSAALDPYPTLKAYLDRCLARPAFTRSLEAQLQVFREHTPAAAGCLVLFVRGARQTGITRGH